MCDSLPNSSQNAKNLSPCSMCKRLHRKCDGGYPCNGCMRSRDRSCAGHCKPSMRPFYFHVGLKDDASAHGLDNPLKFILEDPSQPTEQYRSRDVFPDNRDESDATPVVTSVNSGPPPVINEEERNVVDGQPSTYSAIEDFPQNWPVFMALDGVFDTAPQADGYQGDWVTESWGF